MGGAYKIRLRIDTFACFMYDDKNLLRLNIRDNMNTDSLTNWVSSRQRDMNVMLIAYVLVSLALLFLIAFKAPFENGSVQTAVIVFGVTFNFVAVVWFDGCISAIAAGANDMEEDLSSSSLGKLYAKIPFNLFRVMVGSVGVLNTVFLVIAALS